MSSSRRNCSGPAISTMPLTGDPRATLPTALATSSAAMGWIRTGASRTLDQLLLGNLGAAVSAFGKSIGSHDRQRDVVGDAFGGFNVEQIAG